MLPGEDTVWRFSLLLRVIKVINRIRFLAFIQIARVFVSWYTEYLTYFGRNVGNEQRLPGNSEYVVKNMATVGTAIFYSLASGGS